MDCILPTMVDYTLRNRALKYLSVLFLRIIYFIVYVFCLHMCIYVNRARAWCFPWSREGVGFPGNWSYTWL